MNKRNYAKLLLSSREREALCKAAKAVYANDNSPYTDFADHLCDELDDGGIWNPAFLIVVPDVENKHPKMGSAFSVGYILEAGANELPQFKHDLEMVKDRMLYVTARNNGPKNHPKPKPPFLTRNDYYGPNWQSVRENVIQRDDEECVVCSLGRSTHQQRYNTDLHVHHRRPLKEFDSYKKANKLKNLMTLCRFCHCRIG